MSADKLNAAEDATQAPEPDEKPPRDSQEQSQPEAAPVEKPMILWRSLMLEQ